MKKDTPSSAFKLEIPEYYNFAHDVIDRRGLEERTRLAMIWVSDRGGSRKLTFWDFMVTSNRVANFLKSIGLRKGARVRLMMPRIPSVGRYSALGAMKLGSSFCRPRFSISAREIAFRLQLPRGSRRVITDEPNAEKIDQVREEFISVTEFIALWSSRAGLARVLGRSRPLLPNSASGWANRLDSHDRSRGLLYFTSGTTGSQKMVMHDQAYACAPGDRATMARADSNSAFTADRDRYSLETGLGSSLRTVDPG